MLGTLKTFGQWLPARPWLDDPHCNLHVAMGVLMALVFSAGALWFVAAVLFLADGRFRGGAWPARVTYGGRAGLVGVRLTGTGPWAVAGILAVVLATIGVAWWPVASARREPWTRSPGGTCRSRCGPLARAHRARAGFRRPVGGRVATDGVVTEVGPGEPVVGADAQLAGTPRLADQAAGVFGPVVLALAAAMLGFRPGVGAEPQEVLAAGRMRLQAGLPASPARLLRSVLRAREKAAQNRPLQFDEDGFTADMRIGQGPLQDEPAVHGRPQVEPDGGERGVNEVLDSAMKTPPAPAPARPGVQPMPAFRPSSTRNSGRWSGA
ncbi:hypothetical protein [Streptomyces shenzhenensis]|uniref:Uncharacterized protein n=1 Tax=Streptomyces shenzhenensis TaxID=943815 RepID=A0A3M0IBD8_9ACTN|nr:hypothetical protein [Streptomyces shenzhenensis]RMB84063.1 hypothetical protein CTZ28_21415 [Streptomyces shenzhenensis]